MKKYLKYIVSLLIVMIMITTSVFAAELSVSDPKLRNIPSSGASGFSSMSHGGITASNNELKYVLHYPSSAGDRNLNKEMVISKDVVENGSYIALCSTTITGNATTAPNVQGYFDLIYSGHAPGANTSLEQIKNSNAFKRVATSYCAKTGKRYSEVEQGMLSGEIPLDECRANVSYSIELSSGGHGHCQKLLYVYPAVNGKVWCFDDRSIDLSYDGNGNPSEDLKAIKDRLDMNGNITNEGGELVIDNSVLRTLVGKIGESQKIVFNIPKEPHDIYVQIVVDGNVVEQNLYKADVVSGTDETVNLPEKYKFNGIDLEIQKSYFYEKSKPMDIKFPLVKGQEGIAERHVTMNVDDIYVVAEYLTQPPDKIGDLEPVYKEIRVNGVKKSKELVNNLPAGTLTNVNFDTTIQEGDKTLILETLGGYPEASGTTLEHLTKTSNVVNFIVPIGGATAYGDYVSVDKEETTIIDIEGCTGQLHLDPTSDTTWAQSMKVHVYTCNPVYDVPFKYEYSCTCHAGHPEIGVSACGTCGGTGLVPCPKNHSCGGCETCHHTDHEGCHDTCPGNEDCGKKHSCPASIPIHWVPSTGLVTWKDEFDKIFSVDGEGWVDYEYSYTWKNVDKITPLESSTIRWVEDPYSTNPTDTVYGYPYYIDYTKPTLDITGDTQYISTDENPIWTNKDVNFTIISDDNVSSAKQYSGVKFTGTSVDKVNALTGATTNDKTQTNGENHALKLDSTGVYSINAFNSDKTVYAQGGYTKSGDGANKNEAYFGKVFIDKISPVVQYIKNNKTVWNPVRNRWECSKDNAYFEVRVSDKGGSKLVEASYQVAYSVIPIGTPLQNQFTAAQIQMMDQNNEYLRIEVPDEIKKNGGMTYLNVEGKDGAGNVVRTVVDLSLSSTVESDGTIPGSPYTDQVDDYVELRKVPPFGMFINTSDLIKDNSALFVTRVYDKRWTDSLKSEGVHKDVPTHQMAVYRNEVNDTIGLGYRVDFRYDTVGYGIDDKDFSEIDIVLYGKVGDTYRPVQKVEVPEGKAEVYKDVTNDYNYIRLERNEETYTEGSIDYSKYLLGKYAYTVNDQRASAYFNYYIPANARFTIDGKIYKGNEIYVRLFINSYKFYEASLPRESRVVAHDYTMHADTIWPEIGMNKTFYGMYKVVGADCGRGQSVVFDVVNSAISSADLEGKKDNNN